MTTVESKIILDKETTPQVELDFMNNTHHEEIEMVKELGVLIIKHQSNETQDETLASVITNALKDWLLHTEAHFSRENTLMKETNFPALSIHMSEHVTAYNQMAEIVSTWIHNKDIDIVAEYVFSSWPNWFNAHVNSMDMMTAKFAIMNGYNNH